MRIHAARQHEGSPIIVPLTNHLEQPSRRRETWILRATSHTVDHPPRPNSMALRIMIADVMNRACHRIECVNDGMCGVWCEVCGVKEENLHGPEWTSLSCGGGECAPSSLFSHRSGCSGSLFELLVCSALIHSRVITVVSDASYLVRPILDPLAFLTPSSCLLLPLAPHHERPSCGCQTAASVGRCAGDDGVLPGGETGACRREGGDG